MKKRAAIIYSGQIRSNSLNPNYTSDNIILDSTSIYFLNERFKEKYDYDVFISTDFIDVDKAKNYFGENLKNIHLTDLKEQNWVLNNVEINIPHPDYYYNKFINKKDNDNCILNGIPIYQYYRMYYAYLMMKEYQRQSRVTYDYLVRIRPDCEIIQDIFPLFQILENSSKQIIIEHEQLGIFKYEMEDIFRLVEYYGCYNESTIFIKNSIYKYITAGGDLIDDIFMRYCPEKQFIDHMYYSLLNKNYNYFDSMIGLIYGSFNLVYRGNNQYGYLDKSCTPKQTIDYILNSYEDDIQKYIKQSTN